jgi:uncharacterized membrane protein YbhN (UPF0104 family)
MVSSRVSIAFRAAGLILIGVLVYVFAHHVDWSVLGRALRNAEVAPLVVATLLYFVMLLGKAILWRILLGPNHIVPIRRLYRYTIAAFAGSVLAPARAGELLRVIALKTRDNVPVTDAAGAAVTDKLLHGVTLLMLAAPLPLLLPSLPDWVEHSLLVTAAVAFGLLVVSYFAVRHVETRGQHSWFARSVAGMHAVREPKRLFAALGVITLVWLVEMVAIVATLQSVHIDASMSQALLILFTLNLSIALPTTPANVGALQLGVLVATGLLGIASEPALAFALLYHAIQIVPLLIVAAVLEFRLVIPGGARGKLTA